jgi:hypothetical protein
MANPGGEIRGQLEPLGAVPEPTTLLLLGTTLTGLGFANRWRQRRPGSHPQPEAVTHTSVESPSALLVRSGRVRWLGSGAWTAEPEGAASRGRLIPFGRLPGVSAGTR